jgi:two-component system, NarL family, nitrate/nitrite response regulator NarL
VSNKAALEAQGEPIRVLLVAGHEHVLWGLSKLIDGEWPRMMVIGMSRDAAQARALIETRTPDVIVLDIDVSGENVSHTVAAMLASARSVVIAHTASRDAGTRRKALLAGARCVIDKEAPAETLLGEIERAHRGRTSSRDP